MKVSVLGASGTMGKMLSEELERGGAQVLRVSRSAGIDVSTREGLERAVADADVVVDALNHMTPKAKEAVEYFSSMATRISRACAEAGVQRIACVSIAGVSDPKVSRGYGYYQGKAAQEKAYREGSVPVTLLHSTQWFELVPVMSTQVMVGPIAIMPTMLMAPVAARRVAEFLAQDILQHGGPDGGDRAISIGGPQVMDTKAAATEWLEIKGSIDGKKPRTMIELPLFGRAIADGGLIPQDPTHVDELTLEEWLLGEPERSSRD